MAAKNHMIGEWNAQSLTVDEALAFEPGEDSPVENALQVPRLDPSQAQSPELVPAPAESGSRAAFGLGILVGLVPLLVLIAAAAGYLVARNQNVDSGDEAGLGVTEAVGTDAAGAESASLESDSNPAAEASSVAAAAVTAAAVEPIAVTPPDVVVEGEALKVRGTLPPSGAAAFVGEFALLANALGYEFIDETLTSEQATIPAEIPADFVDAVFFAKGSDQLDAASFALLDGIAAYLDAGSAELRIVAHTDASGSESENLHLAQHRAGEVFKYLVARGVPAERISVDARGETEASGATGTDAERERRVEFAILTGQ